MEQTILQTQAIKGYLYIVVESFTVATATQKITCHLSLGDNAKCQTRPSHSGETLNEVFLIQVVENNTRLNVEFKQDLNVLGECRYNIVPFLGHQGLAHTMTSDVTKSDQQKIGTFKVKITYFSGEFGKIKLRVFHLEVGPGVLQFYKQAKLKAKINIYAQSSVLWDMKTAFDQTLQLLVLTKNSNLQFQLVHTEGVLAKYTIYDLQKSGLLVSQPKAFQVSLFNKDKAVANIKYQIEWTH